MNSVACRLVDDLPAQAGDAVFDDDLVDTRVEALLEQREPNLLFHFGCHPNAEAELGVDRPDVADAEGRFDRENLLSRALDDTRQDDDAVVGAHVDGLEAVLGEGLPDPFGELLIARRLGRKKPGRANDSKSEKQNQRKPLHHPLF